MFVTFSEIDSTDIEMANGEHGSAEDANGPENRLNRSKQEMSQSAR